MRAGSSPGPAPTPAGTAGGGRECSGAWLAVLDTHIPQTVRAMIEAQLDRLEPPAGTRLEAAAVGGRRMLAGAVAGALGEDVVRAEHACDDLARRYRFLEPAASTSGRTGRSRRTTGSSTSCITTWSTSRSRSPAAPACTGAAGLADRSRRGASGRRKRRRAWRCTSSSGRDWPRAVKYLRHAAHAATRQYAHREAVHYLRRALAALDRLSAPERASHAEDELDVLMCLGVNLQVTQGFAAPEVSDIHARAYALCQRRGGDRDPDNLRRTFPVLWGIWVFHKVRSDLGRARRWPANCWTSPGESGDDALLLQAHQAASVTALCLGQPAVALGHMEEAATIYDPARHAGNTERFGQDPGVSTMAFGAVAQCLLGRPQEAVATSGRAIELARQSGQPSSLALAMHFAAMLHQLPRGRVRNGPLGPGDGRPCDRGGVLLLAGRRDGIARLGEGGRRRGRRASEAEAGIAEIRRGVDAWLATGSLTYHAYHLGLLADALLRLGRGAEAAPLLEKALRRRNRCRKGCTRRNSTA